MFISYCHYLFKFFLIDYNYFILIHLKNLITSTITSYGYFLFLFFIFYFLEFEQTKKKERKLIVN